MRITNVLLALALTAVATGQTGKQLMSGSGNTVNAAFRYETRLEPATPDISANLTGGIVVSKTIVHRYMAEGGTRRYFGYDLLIDQLPQANSYQVTVSPLSLDSAGLRLKDSATWSKLPLPGYPGPQILHGGDTIALDLLINPATGQKIVDYVYIQNQKRLVYTASGQARDFSVEDAELRLMDPRVTVNGSPVEATASNTGGVAGAVVWFYLPERGRYFLSLVPHSAQRFEKAGEIRGSALNFTINGEHVLVECNGRIAPGYAAYNLYVLHQPWWRPKDQDSQNLFLLTGGDRLDLLLRN